LQRRINFKLFLRKYWKALLQQISVLFLKEKKKQFSILHF